MADTMDLDARLGLFGILQELTVAALALSDPSGSVDDFLQNVAARFGGTVALLLEAVGDTKIDLTVSGSAGLGRGSRSTQLPSVTSLDAIASLALPYLETADPHFTRWVVSVESSPGPLLPSSLLVLVFAREPRYARQYRGMLQRVAKHLGMALRHRALYAQLVDRERHLRLASSRLQALIDHLPSGVLAADDARLVTRANQAFCNMFEIDAPPSALLGCSAPALLQSISGKLLDPPGVGARIAELLTCNDVHLVEEMRLVDGRIIEYDYVPIQLDGARVGTLWTLRDVTRARQAGEEIRVLNEDLERRVATRTHELATTNQELASSMEKLRETQDQLLQASKLAAVGQLAAGVGHEINNPLAYVLGNAVVLAEELSQLAVHVPATRLKDCVEMVGEIRQGAERIGHVVSGLRTFGRIDPERRVPVEIERVLESAIRMSFTQIRHSARLVRDYHSTPPVHADETRLGQVFINLLMNAAQAIPDGNAVLHEIRIATATDSLGRAVIEVHDTGHGMSPEVRARVFEPFFTTKAIGSGTGLGLSICHGIVTSLGGELSVESTLGAGATFRVVLPAAPVESNIVVDPPPGATQSEHPCAVLVVDDEPQVGRALARMLARDNVTVVTSALAALASIAKGPTPDVVFCDLMMPDMSGMDLHAKLLQLRPDIAERMVFMTGGVFTVAAREFVEKRLERCIDKPFRPDQIRAIVRDRMRSYAPIIP